MLFFVLSNAELFWFKYLDFSLHYEYSVGNRERWRKNCAEKKTEHLMTMSFFPLICNQFLDLGQMNN